MKKLFAIILLALFSIGNAVYLTQGAIKYKEGALSKFVCDINATFSCSSLFAFDFTWIYGIPFPAIALVVYPIIMLIAFLGIKQIISKKTTYKTLATLGIGGILFNSYIIFNEFQVGVFCIACLLCSLSILTILILSIFGIKEKTLS